MTYRIHRATRPEAVVLAVSGVLGNELTERLKELLDAEADARIVLDLADVTLVDRAAVRFLADVEGTRTAIVNCPAYVRSWIEAERAND
jgi:anti-anti-sigma regulatory factor